MDRIKLKDNFECSRLIHGYWRSADWNMSPKEILELIEQTVALGITSFDHADIYGNYSCEKIFGDALSIKKEIRKELQIITKCGIKLHSDKFPERKIKSYDYSTDYIISSVNNSLSNFGTDYIDLLLLHRPAPFFDPEEVAKAFSQLRSSGKVLHFGVSNFTPRQYEMLEAYLDFELVTNQVEISPYCLEHFDNGNMDFFLNEKINPMAWSPLAGGRIFQPQDDRSMRIFNVMKEIERELEVEGIDKVAYCWLLQHPVSILPIVGSGKITHIKSAVEALEVKMSMEQWYKIYIASTGSDLP